MSSPSVSAPSAPGNGPPSGSLDWFSDFFDIILSVTVRDVPRTHGGSLREFGAVFMCSRIFNILLVELVAMVDDAGAFTKLFFPLFLEPGTSTLSKIRFVSAALTNG